MAAETATSVSKGSWSGGLGWQKDGDHCPGTKKDFWTAHHRRKMILATFGASSVLSQQNIAQNSKKM